MKYFYKIEKGKLIRGSGYKVPDGFIEYEKGNEPQEFLDLYIPELLFNAKQSKKQELTTAFDNILSQGYVCPTSGIKMDATYNDILKIKSAVDLANLSGSDNVILRDYDNKDNSLSVTDATTLLTELGQNYQAQLHKLWGLKDTLEKATTINDVNNVTWE